MHKFDVDIATVPGEQTYVYVRWTYVRDLECSTGLGLVVEVKDQDSPLLQLWVDMDDQLMLNRWLVVPISTDDLKTVADRLDEEAPIPLNGWELREIILRADESYLVDTDKNGNHVRAKKVALTDLPNNYLPMTREQCDAIDAELLAKGLVEESA